VKTANPNKTKRTRLRPKRNLQVVRDADDSYFRKHFAHLVRKHGGEWIVLSAGKLIGIGKKDAVSGLVSKARVNYPKSTPFIAPIPTKDEIECVL
jgi:hypothetical protein